MEKRSGELVRRIFEIFKKHVVTFFAGFVFALLCFVTINAAMEPISRSKFCGSNCHEMHDALKSWEMSVHGGNTKGLRAECIDCHLPQKDSYFRHLVTKSYAGGKHLFQHYVGVLFGIKNHSEKPLVSDADRTERVKNEICTRCHSGLLNKPSNDTIREAHMAALESSDNSEQTRCVECHEDAGHQQ